MVQWLRIHLAMKRISPVWSLIQEDPTCCCATNPASHNYWAGALEPTSHSLPRAFPRACTPQLLKLKCPTALLCNTKKPLQREAQAPQLGKSPHSNKDPAQPKINKIKLEGSFLMVLVLFLSIWIHLPSVGPANPALESSLTFPT